MMTFRMYGGGGDECIGCSSSVMASSASADAIT